MNTKALMTVSSLFLGLAGIFALFVPQELLVALGLDPTNPLPVIIEILGALYLSFAITNWTAKAIIIGGVYARPTSIGNFAHFAIGTLSLAKFQFTHGGNLPLFIGLIIYAIFAIIFGWLVFVYSGIPNKHEVQE